MLGSLIHTTLNGCLLNQSGWLEGPVNFQGELARIALLRALDPRTKVLIADEITAQLDAHLQKDIWQF